MTTPDMTDAEIEALLADATLSWRKVGTAILVGISGQYEEDGRPAYGGFDLRHAPRPEANARLIAAAPHLARAALSARAERAALQAELDLARATIAALSPPPDFEEGAATGLAIGADETRKLRAELAKVKAERDESRAYAVALEEEMRDRVTATDGKLMSDSDFDCLILDGIAEALKAMRKFPQPNYVISKIAEEAGEVVKAAIHCAEGRETASNVRGEMKQLIAMIYRLWVEGDQVHGLPSVSAALQSATPTKEEQSDE